MSPLARLATRVAYGATQLPRLAWYAGHGYALQRLAAEARRREGQDEEQETPRRDGDNRAPVLSQRRLYGDMAELLGRDLANVEAGLYPLPADHDGSPATLIRRSRLFFDDLPEVHRRRKARRHDEVRTDAVNGKRPDYYLQNFHYQSGGWLTEDSADRYDTQVEVLFKGTANAMRRMALPELHEVFRGRDQRTLRLIDIGCGTGRFLDFVKQAWPRLTVTGIDLSDAYIRHARHHLRRWRRVNTLVAKAEGLPLPDASQDAVTSVFMMHELPPKIRREMIGEAARVLKPGGRLVIVDSLQRRDVPDYEGLLERFPQNYHEPYFESYLDEDFGAIAKAHGLTHVRDEPAFVSKVMVFDKEA
ncbi:MAG: class I SAM-dependent methyltransferase [Pseudorhodoplanes sp.]|uniref:class I SAM-dependent methyltransferase n=1 Tax=Pseudorhodoplanes sp. TaxID=1934341 RepID=UPI003D0E1117